MEPLQGARVKLVTAQCERTWEMLDFMVQSAWAQYSASFFRCPINTPRKA
jgi:hypothetical protein